MYSHTHHLGLHYDEELNKKHHNGLSHIHNLVSHSMRKRTNKQLCTITHIPHLGLLLFDHEENKGGHQETVAKDSTATYYKSIVVLTGTVNLGRWGRREEEVEGRGAERWRSIKHKPYTAFLHASFYYQSLTWKIQAHKGIYSDQYLK